MSAKAAPGALGWVLFVLAVAAALYGPLACRALVGSRAGGSVEEKE